MKILLESELKKVVRHIGRNPFTFLSTHIIPNGSFVSIGYIKDDEISVGPRTRKYITPKSDAELTQFLETMPEGKFKDALQAFQASDKYQGALQSGGSKSAPLVLDGDVHIIKLGRHIVNWRNNESLAKFYADRSEEELRLRNKYGFGKEDDEYSEDDWRRDPKYKGTGLYPVISREGNKYRAQLGSGFYANVDDPSKIATRQIHNPKTSKTSLWYFIDGAGNIMDLDTKLMAFLTYSFKQNKVKDVAREIAEDERLFIDELNNIKNSNMKEMNLMFDKILYLVGTTGTARKGDQEAFLWLNDEIILDMYPYINRDMLNMILKNTIKLSEEDIAGINESLNIKRNRYYKPNMLVEKALHKMHKSLNEAISEDTFNDGRAEVEEVLNNCIAECDSEEEGIRSFITDILGNLDNELFWDILKEVVYEKSSEDIEEDILPWDEVDDEL